MPTPYCHRLLDVAYAADEGPIIDPNSARCVGSACAAWSRDPADDWKHVRPPVFNMGHCGLVRNGQSFPDPSAPREPEVKK